jgi:hypothetical protein
MRRGCCVVTVNFDNLIEEACHLVAKDRGEVRFGDTTAPATKRGRSWVVPTRVVETAITSAKRARKRIEHATTAYEKGVLLGQDGDTVITSWGCSSFVPAALRPITMFGVKRRRPVRIAAGPAS